MTVYAIDVQTQESEPLPVRDMTTDLDGVIFRIVLTWRERQACWYLDLYTAENVALALGVAMRPNAPVLKRRIGAPWPDGCLMLAAVSGDAAAPETMEGLGVTHELIYLDAATMAEVRAEPAADALIVDHGA